jgi:NADH-quinone oxidoreductase subunit C
MNNIPKVAFQLNNLVPTLLSQNFNHFEFTITILLENLLFSLSFLKRNIGFQYNLLSCISGVDLLKNSYRFLISYELLSLVFNSRLRIKILISEYSFVPSIISIFVNANWWEREIWDLYGIFFENHSDLRRILTDYGFEGYPLRKDFPLMGFNEIYYDQNQKRIVYETIQFSQEFRLFNYEMPW